MDPKDRAEVPENVRIAVQKDSLLVCYFGGSTLKRVRLIRPRARTQCGACPQHSTRGRGGEPLCRASGPKSDSALSENSRRHAVHPFASLQGSARDFGWVRAGQLYPFIAQRELLEVRGRGKKATCAFSCGSPLYPLTQPRLRTGNVSCPEPCRRKKWIRSCRRSFRRLCRRCVATASTQNCAVFTGTSKSCVCSRHATCH